MKNKSKMIVLLITIAFMGMTGCSKSENDINTTSNDCIEESTEVELEKDIASQEHEVIEENSDNNIIPVEDAVLNGDFSSFAGSYMATLEHHDAYGGGKKLESLTLNADGSISGGKSYYSDGFYPEGKPIEIEKKEDGSYICKITKDCHYTIYPTGVIEDDQYVKENQEYLRDTVYINCVVFDGGVLDITYYLEKDKRSIDSIIEDYSGVDWVSLEEVQEEKGKSFISGTGIEYTVIDEKVNDDSGRISLVLESACGQKRVIGNIPAFKLDTETGVMYYDIYEYTEN